MRSLHIAAGLSLPLETVTQTIAVLAKRRAGKSYTMRRLVEQLFHAGQQVVLVDPKGDQWGVRSAADGKGPGVSMVILGGERGDVPLEPSAGEVVAKLVVEERVSVVLDLSLFRKHEVATFMTAFLENLYRLKARETYRTPMMLVIDEADAIAPQKPQKGEERMLGAAEDIVRRGGQRGIGCVLVSQRSAVLNKNVLTQTQILVTLRTIAPQDLAAMDAWIQVHGTPGQRQTLMDSLPSLPTGDAWFWSPGWPTVDGIFKRVHIAPIETFDSSATPAPGAKVVEPKRVAEVDLAALKRQMAATIEKAKADDPRELRRQIAGLRQELARKPDASHSNLGVATLTDADRARVDKLQAVLIDVAGLIHQELELASMRFRGALDESSMRYRDDVRGVTERAERTLFQALEKTRVKQVLAKVASAGGAAPIASRVAVAVRTRPTNGTGDSALSPGERAVLTAALQYPQLDKTRLGVLTGYKRSSRDAYVSRLRAVGLIEDAGGGMLVATDAGRAAMNGTFEPLPVGRALVEYWLQRLPKGEREVFTFLVERAGDAVARERIDEATGYKRSSRDAYLGRLKARGLVTVIGSGLVRAAEEVFQ